MAWPFARTTTALPRLAARIGRYAHAKQFRRMCKAVEAMRMRVGRVHQQGQGPKPNEFGVKVSIVTTLKDGLTVGMRSMPGQSVDGHTLAETLEQVSILVERKATTVIVDKGYRGVELEGVCIPHLGRSGQRQGVTRALKATIHRRSAIEPAIGHMKMDGRLARNAQGHMWVTRCMRSCAAPGTTCD